MSDIRQQIEESLAAFGRDDLKAASIGLLNALGYQSEKTLDLDNTPDAFLSEFDKRDRKLRQDKALFARWQSVELLFQLTDDEIRNAGAQGTLDFGSAYAPGNYQSYLFFALDLEKDHYTRTQLADITREINLLFDMPAMLLVRHDGALTFAVIDRRLSKKDQGRDVLEKVKLIKDIRCHDPHRAHIEILHDLALPSLMAKHECHDFKQLHEAWRKTLDTNELNRKFYRELADWYFWALDHVEFPADVEKDASTRNATNVIRLLTRLIFCWFLKEKGLIPASLFSVRHLDGVLKSLKDDDSTFYRAILQNLFFGTLNQRMNTGGQENRKFANDGSFQERKDEYGVKNLYRNQKLFAIADEDETLKLFAQVPFLNGGLFDCLDKEDDTGKVIYVDGFTRNARKQPKVPNFLFFSDYRTLDLSAAFGDKKHKKEKVRGLINLLDSYKFTITENTPIEEEIALDPELLGKVFENLLASYNPETGTTARKQTGSFYTPREIVNYMVDESLKAHFIRALTESAGMTEADARSGLDILFAYTEKEHAFSDREVDTLIEAIDTCKILDPACGSGAFPMGILHKLVFILGKLDPHNERWKHKQVEKAEQIPDVSARETAVAAIEKDFETNDLDYGRKLYLIENCIYGVDIQPIAIQISKLRFFISLVCDQRTNKNKAQNCGVRPLPNLETKFVAANTLISLDRGQDQGLLMDQRLPTLEKQLAEIRHKHFAAQRRRVKLALQKKDATLREEIAAVLADGGMSGDASHRLAAWDPYDQNNSAPFFDPEWMYGIAEGFHVVLGNPPYGIVFEETMKRIWELSYPSFKRNNDIYVAFYERGLQLTARDGQLAYISPNTFLNGDYFKGLRACLTAGSLLREVRDFKDSPVFQDPTVFVCICRLTCGEPAEFPYAFELLEWTQSSESGDIWDVGAVTVAGASDKPLRLGDPVFERIQSDAAYCTVDDCFYVKDVGFNYWTKGRGKRRGGGSIGQRVLYAGKKKHKDDIPFIKGRDIERWVIVPPSNYLKHDYESDLDPEIDTFRFTPRFLLQNPKVVYRQTANRIIAAIDTQKRFLDKTVHLIVPKDTWNTFSPEALTGLLNSRLFLHLYTHLSQESGARTFAQVKTTYIKRLPVPHRTGEVLGMRAEVDAISKLAQKIMAAKKDDPDADTAEWEREIDERVYRLYGLTKDEIAIVEGGE